MDSLYLYDKLDRCWSTLEEEGRKEGLAHGRKYSRLDLKDETGFRLSCCFPDRSLELLIELEQAHVFSEFSFPDWKGMRFELINLSVPAINSNHLSLKLEHGEFRDIFTVLCADLANDLLYATSDTRMLVLASFLNRWTNFFEKYGQKGLSSERQRGLFGELYWLRKLLENDIGCMCAINAWNGCEKGYHDFKIGGLTVEVKTTISKEPRRVFINNERQLDDRGLTSLHLLVLSLIMSDGGGETLPEIIDSILLAISDYPFEKMKFQQCLINAGYLDIHKSIYLNTYTIKKEELFIIKEGFPRIIDMPNGLGDIKYSLTIAAAKSYLFDINKYLEQIKETLQ